MVRQIPLAKPDITELEVDYVSKVLRSGVLSIGRVIEQFEQQIVDLVGVKHAVAVNSGTSALHLLIRAYGIGEGDEVITTPFSFVASTNCILFERAVPVFVDIDPDTYNLDISQIEPAITPKTKAILPVDVFGQPYDYEAVHAIARKYNLLVIQDSCEAIGSSWKDIPAGKMADAATFAFYPNKQITTAEGGVIVTESDEIADLCRSMRSQGRAVTGTWLYHERLGYNYRMSEVHAAIGVAQMERLEQIVSKRQQVADLYNHLLSDMPEVDVPYIHPNVTRMSWFVYVISLKRGIDRNAVMTQLQQRGIGCKPYFTPIHLQKYIIEQTGSMHGDYPITEDISSRTIALPFYTSMECAQVEYVVNTLKSIISSL